jgi:hypothetical protein
VTGTYRKQNIEVAVLRCICSGADIQQTDMRSVLSPLNPEAGHFTAASLRAQISSIYWSSSVVRKPLVRTPQSNLLVTGRRISM